MAHPEGSPRRFSVMVSHSSTSDVQCLEDCCVLDLVQCLTCLLAGGQIQPLAFHLGWKQKSVSAFTDQTETWCPDSTNLSSSDPA